MVNVKGEHHITLTIGIPMEKGKEISLETAHRIATDAQNLIMQETGTSRVVAHVEPHAEPRE